MTTPEKKGSPVVASPASTNTHLVIAAQPESTETPTAADEDFITSLRIDQSYGADSAIGVRRPLLTVPIRKPAKTDFFRVHPEHCLDVFSVELKAEREYYFALPAAAAVIAEFVEPVRLFLCVTRQGTAFLWPVKLPKDGQDRRGDAWRQSAMDSALLARSKWVRIVADMNLGAYQPFEAIADLDDPSWPVESWPAVVKVALRDRIIDSPDHAVVRGLLGQV